MDDNINISGLEKSEVFRVLYGRARTQGMGFLHYTSEPMTTKEAKEAVSNPDQMYFDYYRGRVMKVDLSGEEFSPRLYDRDNGDGAAKSAVDSLSL